MTITADELREADAEDNAISRTGSGPLEFDVDMARDHGWTYERIAAVYNQIEAIVDKAANEVAAARPELYEEQELFGEKIRVFVGDLKATSAAPSAGADSTRGRSTSAAPSTGADAFQSGTE